LVTSRLLAWLDFLLLMGSPSLFGLCFCLARFCFHPFFVPVFTHLYGPPDICFKPIRFCVSIVFPPSGGLTNPFAFFFFFPFLWKMSNGFARTFLHKSPSPLSTQPKVALCFHRLSNRLRCVVVRDLSSRQQEVQ